MVKANQLILYLVMGTVAMIIGGIFVGLLWDTTVARTGVNNLGPGRNETLNGTTAIFYEMIPWMTAIGLIISAVSIFIINTGKRKRL